MNKFFICICSIAIFSLQAAQFDDELQSVPAFNMGDQQFPLDFGAAQAAESEDEPDSGNWYEKLHWWKEAKRVYTVDIHDVMEQLKGIAQDYEAKKKTLLTKVHESVASLPVTPQAVEPIIAAHLADLKAQRERLLADQTQDQRLAITEIEDQEKTLETLKQDFENLTTLVSHLEEALNVVAPKQVKECENYEERALEYFERIEKVLDDKKAHHYYDIVENSLENIRAIIQYLIGPLQIFIDDTVGRFDALIPKIKTTIEELEKKGITVRILTEKEKAEAAALAKKKEEARLKAEADKKAAEAWKNMSWWRKIFYWIGSFFAWIWSAIKSLFSSIGGLFSGGGKAPSGTPSAGAPPTTTPIPVKKL